LIYSKLTTSAFSCLSTQARQLSASLPYSQL